jgi:hypothetical protein
VKDWQSEATYQERKRKRSACTASPFLILHLIIRVDKVVIIVLVVLALKLLVGLAEVDVLTTRAAAYDVGCLNLLHVVLIGLFGCSYVSRWIVLECSFARRDGLRSPAWTRSC